MSVGYPDLLICKLGAIDALGFRAIVVDNDLATLHHEARDDALEYSSAVMQVQA